MDQIPHTYMTKLKKALLIASIAIAGAAGIFAVSVKDNFFEISKNLEIFATVYRELNIFYVDETQPGELMKTGIDAMLQSLDPYTNYITESDIEDFRFMTTGQYGGIGSLIRTVDGDVYISEPYEGSPAIEAGLKAGDKILKIDGRDIKGKNQEEISKLLKGQSGTSLKVTYERNGQVNEVPITRREIKIPDVPYFGMIEDGVGYIRLTSFTNSAGREVRDAFVKLRDEQGMKKLVFDLRGNGGGLLKEAVNIVNFFVPKGQMVVRTKGKIAEWDQTYSTLGEPLDTEIPLVILVDPSSASASEIVAGALQDLDRAVVIGQRTFGKGLVQQTRDLQYNSKLKLTVAKYYIPSGRCIQKLDYANKVDGSAEEIPDSLLKVFKTRNGRNVIDGRGIEPDIKLPMRDFPPVLGSLMEKNLFFKYANKYVLNKAEIPEARSFRLSEDEYKSFVEWLGGQDYEYTTDTEALLAELTETATREKYYQLASEEFDLLIKKLKAKKKQDLWLFRDDIQMVLEDELVSRYYLQRGRIEASFSTDEFIASALDVLGNPQTYRGILTAGTTTR
jgi:carboxyl-terminal processing protease